MTIQSWLMYLTLVLVATATPGPAVLYIVTNASLHGWRKAVFAALGNIAGLFTLGIIAVTGLGMILKTSELIFDLIKYAGAVYLVYLGLRMILQEGLDFAKLNRQAAVPDASGGKVILQALGVALSNPKAIIFLTALFPQFISTDRALFPQFALLMATLMSFSFFFLMSYALLAHSAKEWLNRQSRVKAVNRASGSIFIGFGLLLATSSNK
ncbi:MAG: LysE family translocator [Deltaproteobacteria bacterium]